MIKETGNMTINTDNIFPIIKKWLYSDKDIFLRELVSNSCDAISKHQKLVNMGDAEKPENGYSIHVNANAKEKTITVSDNGIGMTADELKKYINQIAFSGAVDFIEKYKEKTDASQIIGHFGLGFYSSFMVADNVSVDSLSYIEGAEAAKWTGDGNTTYTIEPSDRNEVGTTVTLNITEDSDEFLNGDRIKEILNKYCSFMPYPIYFSLTSQDEEKVDKKEESKDADFDEADKEPVPINDTQPLWLKNPKDCTDDEYKSFYRKVFADFSDPLFWIHLNMDYPFNMKGILYFPRIRQRFGLNEGKIKLYYNQVFVADNIKEVIPEFLMLLNGVMDCPDLPLNVSRSFLQNDGYVAKISNHITKKVGDKLVSLFETEREEFGKYWDDINPFVKFGCIREPKFYDRVKDIILYRTANEQYVTLNEYMEKAKGKHENQIYYATDERQQARYINMYKENGTDIIMLDSLIDSNFISFLEMKDNNIKFLRVDSEISDVLKDKNAEADMPSTSEIEKFENLFKDTLGKKELKLKFEALKQDNVPSMLSVNEFSRRMQDMSRMYGEQVFAAGYPIEETLVLNVGNNIVKWLINANIEAANKEQVELACRHLYDLAAIAQRPLDAADMSEFLERSTKLMELAFDRTNQGTNQ